MPLSDAEKIVYEFNGGAVVSDSLDSLLPIWNRLRAVHPDISISFSLDTQTFSITLVGWAPYIVVLTGDEGKLFYSAIVATAKLIGELTR